MTYAARLDVQLTPKKNKALQDNITAFIGALDDHDLASLKRYQWTAIQKARQASEALGYYRNSYAAEVLEDDDQLTLRLKVEVAEPVRLREVDIKIEGEAANLEAFRVQDERLQVGKRLNHGAYEDAKGSLQQNGLRYGFFAAQFTQRQLLIDPEAGAADIHLHFDSGPRYRFAEVSFSEGGQINPDLLDKLVPFAAGEPYNSAMLARLSQNLQNTGYFEDVRVDAVGTADGPLDIPVEVHLSPVKPRTLGLGAGFSTDVGPRARFNWERHRVNSRGHKIGVESEWSKPKQNLSAWYAIPLSAPLTDQLRVYTGYQKEAYVDAQSERLTFGAQWHKQVRHDWMRIIGLRWEEERYDYGRGTPRQRSQFLLPSIGYSTLQSDSPLDPSRGYRLQADVSAAKQDVLADADVFHATLLARGLITLADKHRLLGRVELGGVATNNYAAIPPSLRFFAGGDQSVRGYDYQSLSPRDKQRNRVGGRYLIAQSLEYQYSLVDKWRVAGFVDRGNAVDSLTDAMNVGVGTGVRWVSPIGPLRLDFAHALHGDRGWRIHFSMGPEL